jgi:hypothetical protein
MTSLKHETTSLESATGTLVSLHANCISRKFISHYTVEQELNMVVAEQEPLLNANAPSLIEKYIAIKIQVEEQIERLKNANEVLLKAIDYPLTCIRLINAGDLENLKGLVYIGEYFGIEDPRGKDVCIPLDEVYDFYSVTSSARQPNAKECMDFLCKILNRPYLSFNHNYITPEYYRGITNPRAKLNTILKSDDDIYLMMWMVNATQDDLDFALRITASSPTNPKCLIALLLRTNQANTHHRIDLLACASDSKGIPSSKQIAMHRAIASGSTQIISMMLNPEANLSNELLNQLLVQDRKGLTPIDYIGKISDVAVQQRIIACIRETVDTYETVERYGFNPDKSQAIRDTLDTFKNEIGKSFGHG